MAVNNEEEVDLFDLSVQSSGAASEHTETNVLSIDFDHAAERHAAVSAKTPPPAPVGFPAGKNVSETVPHVSDDGPKIELDLDFEVENIGTPAAPAPSVFDDINDDDFAEEKIGVGKRITRMISAIFSGKPKNDGDDDLDTPPDLPDDNDDAPAAVAADDDFSDLDTLPETDFETADSLIYKEPEYRFETLSIPIVKDSEPEPDFEATVSVPPTVSIEEPEPEFEAAVSVPTIEEPTEPEFEAAISVPPTVPVEDPEPEFEAAVSVPIPTENVEVSEPDFEATIPVQATTPVEDSHSAAASAAEDEDVFDLDIAAAPVEPLPPPVFNKIAHVCLYVKDLKSSAEFYTKLGLQKRFAFNKNGDLFGLYLEFGTGNFVELFEDTRRVDSGLPCSGIAHFCLETPDLDEVMRSLDSRGIEYTPKKLGCDATYQIWLKDPDGNKFEIHQYTPDSSQIIGKDVEADW